MAALSPFSPFGALAEPLGSALAARAYFLLLRQKKVAKEKATPGSAPATRVPCATRFERGLRNSGCALRQSSPFFRSNLRCSAPLRGGQKTSPPNRWGSFLAVSSGRLQKNKDFHFSQAEPLFRDAFPGPHVERRATELMAERGRGLFEGRSPEFRSPRQQRVAQGSRRSRPRSLGAPSSLATFFLAKQEESTPARKAEPLRQTRTASAVAETNAKPARKAEPPRKTSPVPVVSKTKPKEHSPV